MQNILNNGNHREIYEGGNNYKNLTREYTNRASHVGKKKGGESKFPTNPETGHAGKRKTINEGHTRY